MADIFLENSEGAQIEHDAINNKQHDDWVD